VRDLHSRGEEHRQLVRETNLKDCGFLIMKCYLEDHRLRNIRKFDENLIRVECIGVPSCIALQRAVLFILFQVGMVVCDSILLLSG
jgi:hypothetical protein